MSGTKTMRKTVLVTLNMIFFILIWFPCYPSTSLTGFEMQVTLGRGCDEKCSPPEPACEAIESCTTEGGSCSTCPVLLAATDVIYDSGGRATLYIRSCPTGIVGECEELPGGLECQPTGEDKDCGSTPDCRNE